MGGMTFGAADVVTPVFTSSKVVVFLAAGVATKTCFRNFFLRLVLERNDLGGVAFFDVGLAWAMTRFTACYFAFPAADLSQLSVRSMRKGFELIFVAVFTGFTAYIISRIVGCRFDLTRLR